MNVSNLLALREDWRASAVGEIFQVTTPTSCSRWTGAAAFASSIAPAAHVPCAAHHVYLSIPRAHQREGLCGLESLTQNFQVPARASITAFRLGERYATITAVLSGTGKRRGSRNKIEDSPSPNPGAADRFLRVGAVGCFQGQRVSRPH